MARAFGKADPQGDRNGISHSCESIHQEVVFKAARKRVYEAITEEKQFRQVTDFIIKGASTQISPEVGGLFSMFGGVIVRAALSNWCRMSASCRHGAKRIGNQVFIRS